HIRALNCVQSLYLLRSTLKLFKQAVINGLQQDLENDEIRQASQPRTRPHWFHDKSFFALSGPGFLNEALGMHQGYPGRIQRPSIATIQVAREKQMVAGHNKDEDNGTKIHLLMGRVNPFLAQNLHYPTATARRTGPPLHDGSGRWTDSQPGNSPARQRQIQRDRPLLVARRNQRRERRQDIVTGVPGRAPPRQGADAWRLLPSSAPAARKQAAWQERPKALDVIPQCRCSPTYQQERK
ncbi:hypothetical protein VDGL01_01099, partial [Verticillium dahliae]